MNTVTRILAIGALGAASLTQGCGCSSKNDNPVVIEPPPTPATVTITGRAAKGIIGGGVVSAFALNNGVIAATPFITTITDALGKYTIKIPETYIGKPISFRITPALNNTTTLTCDLAAGCGITAFGSTTPILSTSTLKLETIVPTLAANQTVNVSTFTTIAAEQYKKAAVSSADVAAVIAAIKKANGEIANMFGLKGELSALGIIDITNTTEVKNASSDDLRNAALNAAIVGASQAANPGSTLEQAIAKIIADITSKGVASNSSDSHVADLSKIFAAVNDILNVVKGRVSGSGVDLTELLTSVANELGRVRNEPVDVYNTGTVLPDNTLNAKALAFANVVRSLINGGDIVLDAAVGNSTVKAKSDKLRMQWDAAQMLSGADAEAVSKSLSMAAEAIAEAQDAYHYDNTLKTYMAGDITVTIKLVDPKVEYTVDQTISGNAVKLVAASKSTYTTVGTLDTAATPSLDLTGSAANAAVKVSILSGSSLVATKLTRDTKDGVETSMLEGLKLVLNSEVTQLKVGNVTDPVKAWGALTFESGKFTRVKGPVHVDPVTEGVLATSFAGKVSNTTGETVAFALNIAGNTKGVTVDELSQGIDPADVSVTKDNFNSLTAALSFTALLNSQDNAATVKLTTTRESLAATRTTLDLMFYSLDGFHNLRFSTLIKRMEDQPYSLSIIDQDRLTMSLSQTTAGGDVSGTITAPDGVKVLADIVQAPKCLKVSIKEGGEFVCLNDAP